VVISPDAGGVYRAKDFRDGLHQFYGVDSGLAMIIKQRLRANSIARMDLVGSVDGCDCIIVDDMIDTAGTLCKAAGELKERARPAWQFVLLGQQLTDVSMVQGLPNVRLLGQKRHDELPAYCKGLDVGIIPYKIDERMRFVNPLKMREYLSAGLPVVSTAVPEVTRYPDLVQVASTPDEWVAAIERALANNSTEARAARTAAMKTETWSARVAQVAQTIDEISQFKERQA
jgi:glycosyltransferase involved in cell wall biosynthesis